MHHAHTPGGRLGTWTQGGRAGNSVITGASDLRGIGFACARAMAERGATVVLSDIERRANDLDRAVKELTSSVFIAKGFMLDATKKDHQTF